LFLDKYHLNLLAVPREKSRVGDLYVYSAGRTSSPGHITEFLEPKLQLPVLDQGEQMADVQGIVTGAVSFSTGVELLEGFFVAVGDPAIFQGIRTEYSREKAHSFQFSFLQPMRDSIDVGVMGSKLIRHRFKKQHALVNEGNRYYLVTATAKSKNITVSAQTKRKMSVELNTKVLNLAKVANKISLQKSGDGKVTFAGPTQLVFRVEIYVLPYDKEEHKLKIIMPKCAIKVRSGLGDANEMPIKPAFIGDEKGDIFCQRH
jgi:hypothetical protein